MTASELINKWKENHTDFTLNENQLQSIANNLLDLVGAWFMNEKLDGNSKPTYEVRLNYDNGTTIISDVKSETAPYEIMNQIFPNNKAYEKCDLVSIIFKDGKKKETILGSLTIV